MRRAAATGITVAAVVAAAALLGALLLPDASPDPRLGEAAPVTSVGVAHDPGSAVESVCRGRRPVPAPNDVQTSAPRSVVASGPAVQLGVRDRRGAVSRTLLVEVTDPAGHTSSVSARVDGTMWGYVDYPTVFPSAPDALRAGVYRVQWRDQDGGGLACDGFVVGRSP